MAKVSVIVAVYNCADFLPKCLDSLLAQTFKDIEIICIDDCSTDSSASVLADYAQRDKRIKLVSMNQNMGQAHARNAGIKVAEGNYVAFLDSDDWMSDDCLEQAVATFISHPQTDCVLLHVKHYLAGEDKYCDYPMESFEVKSGREAFEESIDWSIHGWYVTRREFYLRYPYDTTCRAYSDDNTTHIHYFNSREVRCCSGIYYYRHNSSSVTQKPTIRRFEWMLANESLKSQLETLGVEQRIMQRYETIRLLVLVDSYMVYHCHGRELSLDDRRIALSTMKRIWHTIDRALLTDKATHKFGYRLMPTWWLFRLQEWLYFTLRGLLGKNKKQ